MRVINPDHRLIAHKLTYLRDERTDSPTFRRLAEELMTLLAYEATREVRVEPFEIVTPVAPTTGTGPAATAAACCATRESSPTSPVSRRFTLPRMSCMQTTS